jgi:GxxExxY protein
VRFRAPIHRYCFRREKNKVYGIKHITKHKILRRFYHFDKIILKVKSSESFHENHISQCLNYLKVSDNKVAILANFNKTQLSINEL